GEAVRAHGDLGGLGEFGDRADLAVQVKDGRCLGVPGRDDRVAPEVAPPGVAHRPAEHRVVRVAGVVVGGVDLQPVPVGAAQVHVERVGDAVPAGPALD